MADKKCEACNGTGYYGDNGPGIRGNREYQPCECSAGRDNEQRDNKLLNEARDVATETGLTPRQLAEQRAELLAACKEMVEWIGDGPDPWVNEAARAVLRIAKAAIAKATGDDSK